jgi:hypothetical protein
MLIYISCAATTKSLMLLLKMSGNSLLLLLLMGEVVVVAARNDVVTRVAICDEIKKRKVKRYGYMYAALTDFRNVLTIGLRKKIYVAKRIRLIS